MKRPDDATAPQDGEDPSVDVILAEIENRVVGKPIRTPEEGCLGCAIGFVLVFISILIWVYIYWYYTPEFHNQGHHVPAFMEDRPGKKLKDR